MSNISDHPKGQSGEGCTHPSNEPTSGDSDEHMHSHAEHSELSDVEVRVRALETILVEKGYVDPATLETIIQTYETKIGPRNGALVVAKAWADEDYKSLLLSDATAAIASLGFTGRQGENIIALENTPTTHNIVVCTLCSCYPWPVLGLPPSWYKSAAYRSRVVREPRSVLQEFGVELPQTTEIHVWDSTAEVRYLVLPMRPDGVEDWDQERLSQLVPRDAMIGAGLALDPKDVTRENDGPGEGG